MSICSNRFTLSLLLAGLLGAAHAGPLSFTAALDLAERQSPDLAASAAQIDAARLAVVPAGALPDPKLAVGIANLPVTGDDRGRFDREPMTMKTIGLAQDIPNGAKRRAREAVAAAGADIAAAQQEILRWQVRREAAAAWLNVYYTERRFALFDELDKENQLLADAIHAQMAGGRGSAVDAVMPRQEAVLLADRRDDLMRDLAKARAALRRLVGSAADASLLGEPPSLTIDAAQLREQLHQHPELTILGAQAEQATAQVREANAMKTSDWGVELAYQQRGAQFSDMVSLQFKFDLPIATARRQDPLVAAKQQELIRIDAMRDATLREHALQLEQDLAGYAALNRQLQRAEQTGLPLAQQKVDLQSASYQAGNSRLADVLAARRELIDQRLKVIELQAQRAVTAAQLLYAYGETKK